MQERVHNVQLSHLHSLALPARASVRTVQVLRGRCSFARSNLLFYGNIWSKEVCHAATPALAGDAREEQERRLVMT